METVDDADPHKGFCSISCEIFSRLMIVLLPIFLGLFSLGWNGQSFSPRLISHHKIHPCLVIATSPQSQNKKAFSPPQKVTKSQ